MNEVIETVKYLYVIPLMVIGYGLTLVEYLGAGQVDLDPINSLFDWVGFALLILFALATAGLRLRKPWQRAGAVVAACLLVPLAGAILTGETWWWHGLPLTVGALLPATAAFLYRPLTKRVAWLERIALMLIAIALTQPAGHLLHLTLPDEPAVAAPDPRLAYYYTQRRVDCPGLDGPQAAVRRLDQVLQLEVVYRYGYDPRMTVQCENITLRGTRASGLSTYYWLSYRHGRETDPWVVRATLDLTAERGLGAALRNAGIRERDLKEFRAEARSWAIVTPAGTYILDDANNLCLDPACQPLP